MTPPAPPARPRVLLTLPDVAWPVDGGKRLRCAGVTAALADLADVDVAVLFSTAPVAGAPVAPEVPVRRFLRAQPPALGAVPALLSAARSRVPVHLGAQRWDEVRRRLAPWTAETYDLVWFGGLDHAWALRDDVRARRVVVDCDDVETEKWAAFLARTLLRADPVQWLQRRVELPLWARVQREALALADAVVVCSDVDAARLGGDATSVVPNTYPDPGPSAPRDPVSPPRLVMIANFHTEQNVDAATHLVHDVLPRLRALLPDARVRLVGRGAEGLGALAPADGLDIVGPVADLGPELSAATAVLVPMRFGGGTRLKVLEAFAHRVPVVSTTLGAEGLQARDGEHLLVRDDPAAFAAAAASLVGNAPLARSLSRAARDLYERTFRPEAAAAAVRAVVEPLLADPGPEPARHREDR